MRSELKQIAWKQAAEWLDRCIDAFDIEQPLSEEDEALVRNYMRNSVLKSIRSSGNSGFQKKADEPVKSDS